MNNSKKKCFLLKEIQEHNQSSDLWMCYMGKVILLFFKF